MKRSVILFVKKTVQMRLTTAAVFMSLLFLVPFSGYGADLSITDVITGNGNMTLTGNMTATSFSGNGSGLTNVEATSVVTGGVTNVMLQNNYVQITAGNGMTGGGQTALGGSVTLNVLNPMQVALLRWYDANQSGNSVYFGFSPVGIAFDGADMWVAGTVVNCSFSPPTCPTLSKVKTNNGLEDGAYLVGGFGTGDLAGMAYDGTNMWVAAQGDNTVTKVQAKDGSVIGTYNGGNLPTGVAFDGTNIWVTNQGDSTVTKLRASDGLVVGTYGVDGAGLSGIAFDGSNIWVTVAYFACIHPCPPMGGVIAIRAGDGQVVSSINTGNSPVGVAFDGANIWVTNQGDSTVTKLRASDASIIGTYNVGTGPTAIAFDGANMWVANTGDNSVTKLRASDGQVIGTYPVNGTPVAIAFDGANMWVANQGTNTLQKL